MSEKIHLYLLILCGILCQGIIAKQSDEDTKEPSNVLTRKRRVITHHLTGLTPTRIEDVPYIVSIREGDNPICTGVILSLLTVITVARCVMLHESVYRISSGSAHYKLNFLHIVTSKIEHYGNPPHQQFDGIALLTVHPPFVYSRRIRNIELYAGPLPVGSLVTVYGWGCNYPPQPGPVIGIGGRVLRSITLPIVNLTLCENIYREHAMQYRHLNIENPFSVKTKHLCTYDPHQYCAQTDAGAPLVFNNMLAAIHVWKGEFQGGRNPDVFIDLRRREYSEWIRENIH